MKNATFTTGQTYGNDLTFEVVKRTAKTAVIRTTAWGEKRVKISSFVNAGGSITEKISFKAWLVYASDIYDVEIASQLSYERAYYS